MYVWHVLEVRVGRLLARAGLCLVTEAVVTNLYHGSLLLYLVLRGV